MPPLAPVLAACQLAWQCILAIDNAMGGGLPNGGIVELVGPAGIGKSQFAMTMVAAACHPQGMDGAVVYIDTERKFSQRRLLQIMQRSFVQPTCGHADMTPIRVDVLAKRVHVVQPRTGKELTQILRHLPVELERRNVKLVVVDSIAMLARLEFDHSQIVARQQMLAMQANLLKCAAEKYRLPVIVVNQVTGGQTSDSTNRAALGIVWAHAVNTRLVLQQRGRVRTILVAKSPLAANVTSSFEIGAAGVEDSAVPVPEMPLFSVIDLEIHADHHFHTQQQH